jgi:hypothetical protein
MKRTSLIVAAAIAAGTVPAIIATSASAAVPRGAAGHGWSAG